MNVIHVFGLQFLWFVLVWAAIANLFVVPMTKGMEKNDQIVVWLSPQLFRVLGLGLLVENLAPSLPLSFALPTAIGDCLTALLALISIIALHQNWAWARRLAWVCNIVGSLDLAIALPHAAVINAVKFLTVQWYVPAVVVPLMIVSHFMTFRVLFRHRS
jgi:hypothetical protein